jgi:cardiolipin synthase
VLPKTPAPVNRKSRRILRFRAISTTIADFGGGRIVLDPNVLPANHLRGGAVCMTIPNLITVFRLVLVPLVVLAILQGAWIAAFAMFVIAGVSDGVDGYIARRFDQRSEFGAMIDPLADKALLISLFVTLAWVGQIPTWIAVLVVFRDAMILMAFIVAAQLTRPMEVKPLLISKANTALQIAYVALVLGLLAFGIAAPLVVAVTMWTVAALTVVTAGAYLVIWLRHMTH